MVTTGNEEITPRDLQVMKWIACGMERDRVAATLGTSRSGVNRHVAKVMRLTATASGAAAVAHVMAIGLLRAQDVTTLTRGERRGRALKLAPDVMREIERGNARLPIPGPRRDPDAPRPPQQPERDS